VKFVLEETQGDQCVHVEEISHGKLAKISSTCLLLNDGESGPGLRTGSPVEGSATQCLPLGNTQLWNSQSKLLTGNIWKIYADNPGDKLATQGEEQSKMKPRLQVMKFGGTSVGDASCIARTAQIVARAAKKNPCVVVVSAMSGVTNRLIEAAKNAQTGTAPESLAILDALRKQHETALTSLIAQEGDRGSIRKRMEQVLADGRRLCEGTALLRELTPRTLDAISSLGERLSAPLVAAAVKESGFPSEAVEATELIVTDSFHGGAEPQMELTREKSQSRLQPILEKGIVPIVTGFIGATPEGQLTTLGRGGSDYSATILGAALGADEVIIWTDVDGVLTADPRLVPDARTIPVISYREAAELAYFGAKVLHPKTLNPVMEAAIPVWIRNSFSPEKPGTKITPEGRSIGGGVKALTAIRDVTLISVGGPGIVGLPDVVGRTFSTTAEVRASVLLISQSSSQNDICFIVSTADAQRTVEALRKEFAQDLAHHKVEHITVDSNIAIVAVVGENMRGTPGIAGKTFNALGRENVNLIAIAQGSSESNISFVIEEKAVKAALLTTHREFGLGASPS
jgi:aspartate kinase